MKLYVVRHGQTDWNLENRMQGQTDVPLNDTGINQARKLKKTLESYDFDICYCSPMKRAVQTASIAVNGRTKILYDDDLKERSYGDYEGVDCATWDIDENNIRLNTNEGGIEPIKDVLARSKRVLKRIKAENPANAKVLVIAHGALLQALNFCIVGYDDDTDFGTFELDNTALAEYEI